MTGREPLLLALAAVLSAPVRAATLAGVTMPDRIEVEGKTLVLNGLGLREATILRVDVYVAGLYLEATSSDPDAIAGSPALKRIQMTLVRDLDRGKIAKAWREGIRKNAGDGFPALRERLESLNAHLTDLRRGDTVTLTQLPGKGITLEVKGETKATVPGDDFARAIWRIWLGPRPPNAGLKRGLLGLGQADEHGK